MIAFLSGEIIAKLDKSLIISNGQIGYEVTITSALFDKTNVKDLLELFIHTNVRESEISLFGFQTIKELNFFRKIINVSGIGPRTGIDFLSIPQEKLKAAIIQKDTAFITNIKGIGKKTAERLILELKEKIDIEDANIDLSREHQKLDDEIFDALKSLGYQNYDIKKVLKSLPADISKTEDIIKYFLQNV